MRAGNQSFLIDVGQERGGWDLKAVSVGTSKMDSDFYYIYLHLSFSCSLIVYKNTIDFCVFNLYSISLLNSLINFSSFYCEFLGNFYVDDYVVCK